MRWCRISRWISRSIWWEWELPPISWRLWSGEWTSSTVYIRAATDGTGMCIPTRGSSICSMRSMSWMRVRSRRAVSVRRAEPIPGPISDICWRRRRCWAWGCVCSIIYISTIRWWRRSVRRSTKGTIRNIRQGSLQVCRGCEAYDRAACQSCCAEIRKRI